MGREKQIQIYEFEVIESRGYCPICTAVVWVSIFCLLKQTIAQILLYFMQYNDNSSFVHN